MLLDEAAQVQHVGLRELLLHLVQLVGAYGVQIAAVELLFQNLRHTQVVQVRGGAFEVVSQELLVAVVFQLVGVQSSAVSLLNLCCCWDFLLWKESIGSVLLGHINYLPTNKHTVCLAVDYEFY